MLSLSDKALELLKTILPTDLVITIGNRDRSDDGAGPFIYDLLQTSCRCKILNAGINPENFIEQAVSLKPSKIIIIDAANFNGKAGDIELVDIANLSNFSLSTHSLPLSLIANLLKNDSGVEVVFVGIQTQDISFGSKISAPVINSCQIISSHLKH